jgi:hypothetical protein
MNNDLEYMEKYLKYKSKYINLKNKIEQEGGLLTTWLPGNYIFVFKGKSIKDNSPFHTTITHIPFNGLDATTSNTGVKITEFLNNIENNEHVYYWSKTLTSKPNTKAYRINSKSTTTQKLTDKTFDICKSTKFNDYHILLKTPDYLDINDKIASNIKFDTKNYTTDIIKQFIEDTINKIETHENIPVTTIKEWLEMNNYSITKNTVDTVNDIDNFWYGMHIEVGVVSSHIKYFLRQSISKAIN